MKKTKPFVFPTDPVAPAPSPPRTEVLRAAHRYVAAGLSIIPIRTNGTKSPAFELLPKVWSEQLGRPARRWKPYSTRRPTVREVQGWFGPDADPAGMAVIGGGVSGGLEVLDLDNWAVVGPWVAAVKERDAGHLLARLVFVQTPRPGLHAYLRSDACGPSQKLAQVPDPATGGKKPKTLIEVKGEGGYVLAPPSPATCHPTRRCYTLLGGKDPSRVPVLTADERAVLLDAARSLNEWTPPARTPRPTTAARVLGRPGDDFNARADWEDILTPHGWSWAGTVGGGEDRWCRPGKAGAVSATTGHGDHDHLFVFSSNADPFDEHTGYTKFAAYALLNHGGDFGAAARALRAKGYGLPAGAADVAAADAAAAAGNRYAGLPLPDWATKK